MLKTRFIRIGPAGGLIFSFAALVLGGALVLYLPVMQGPAPVPWLDCLFTATSAVCVTGLITVDTASAWSPWGQSVILVLFQLGGLGIMTFSLALMHLGGKRPSVTVHLMMHKSFGSASGPEVGRLARDVVLYTLVLEGAGALILFLRFWQDFPAPRALALGWFHAVSAFCNAGFSMFPNSLEDYSQDPVVNLTVIVLLVLGGLGFLVLRELRDHLGPRAKRRLPLLSLNTRLVLMTSAVLGLGGAALLWLLELEAQPAYDWAKNIWPCLFASFTARTTGFDTVPLAQMGNASLLVIMFLMFIGASPGSTGGGIKTTTLATLFALAKARFAGFRGAVVGRRSIPVTQVEEALALVMGASAVLLLGTLLLVMLESVETSMYHAHQHVLSLAFEAVSAFATVGLSLGVTAGLTAGGKLVLIALMFVGRLGPLSFVYSAMRKTRVPSYQPAEERIMLG